MLRDNFLTELLKQKTEEARRQCQASRREHPVVVIADLRDPFGRALTAPDLSDEAIGALVKEDGFPTCVACTDVPRLGRVLDVFRDAGIIGDRHYFSLVGYLRERCEPGKFKALVMAMDGVDAVDISLTGQPEPDSERPTGPEESADS